MMKYLNEREVKLKWIGKEPAKNNKIALLIPQYNESLNCNFLARLQFFRKVAEENRNEIDVIIIDDGSTDNSLEKMAEYLAIHPNSFYVASVRPNANKVGALFLAVLAISHEFIILSDFDTDIIGLNQLIAFSTDLVNDSSLMGGYFRMLPFEGNGNVHLYQQIEYSLARCIYKFHQQERSIRVMPGAGSCYKRDALIAIYNEHSGLRSGEDREATLIGLKLGYKTVYMDNITALTRPPQSVKALIKQRIRWNLGYLETFHKERDYYFLQIKKFSRIGIVTLMDLLATLLTIILPFLFIAIGIINNYYLMLLILLLYIVKISWCYNLIYIAPRETVEIKSKRGYSILMYPVFKIFIDYFSWMGAIINFTRKNLSAKTSRTSAR